MYLITSIILIYRHLRDGWLSWPCWLTDSGWFNHKVVTHPASSLAQDRESSPAETSVLTTILRHQLCNLGYPGKWPLNCVGTWYLSSCNSSYQWEKTNCDPCKTETFNRFPPKFFTINYISESTACTSLGKIHPWILLGKWIEPFFLYKHTDLPKTTWICSPN